MTNTLLWVSMICLWILGALQFILLWAITRQIGILHTRLAPSGARVANAGLELGDRAPFISAENLNGPPIILDGPRSKPALLLFLSPMCPTCSLLLPALKTLHRYEREKIDILLVSLDPTRDSNHAYISQHKLSDMPYSVDASMPDAFHVGVSPYAIVIGVDGTIFTKGLVNTLEHLESLIAALDQGYTSLEDKMRMLTIAPDGAAM